MDDQIHLAHRYYNQLIEIERRRREERSAIMLTVPDVQAADAEVKRLEEELERHLAVMRESRSERRSRRDAQDDTAITRDLRARLKAWRERRKEAKRALAENKAIQDELAAVNERAAAKRREARAACGVFWGSYLLIEQAVDAAAKAPIPPKFRRWTGDGAVAAQIQTGAPWEEIVSGKNRQFAISMEPQPVPGRHGKSRPRVRLRVGSEGRDPVWAEWPLIYHREVPEGSRVKWAKVLRRRMPYEHPKSLTRDVWELLLTLEMPDPVVAAPVRGGTVALDLRWSRIETDGDVRLRSGGWSDDGVVTHEILMQQEVVGGLEKASSLRGIRDREMASFLDVLVSWRRSRGDLTEDWQKRTLNLHAWRSAGKLGALVAWWEENRLDGDGYIFDKAMAWWKQDRHLWAWEFNQREKSLRRRREQYRVIAADFASRYDSIIVEKINLSAPKLSQLPDPKHGADLKDWQPPIGRSQRVECAPSELREAMVHAFTSRGRKVLVVPPGGPAAQLWLTAGEQSDAVVERSPARGGMSARQQRMRKNRLAPDADGAANAGSLAISTASDAK